MKVNKYSYSLARYFQKIIYSNNEGDTDEMREVYRQGQDEIGARGLLAVWNVDLKSALEAKIDSMCLDFAYKWYKHDYKGMDAEALSYLHKIGIQLNKPQGK